MNLGKQLSKAEYRTVWITGASGNVGYALARRLAKARNYVFVSARNERRLNALVEAFPENVFAIPVDVADEQQLSKAVQRLKERTDHLDTIVVAAEQFDDSPKGSGYLTRRNALAEKLMRVNFLGAVNCIHLAMPLLQRSKNSPHIIVLGSLLTHLPFPHLSAYAASKKALEYYVQSLALDLKEKEGAKNAIDVTTVRPWFLARQRALSNTREEVNHQHTSSCSVSTSLIPGVVHSDVVVEQILQAMQSRDANVSFPLRYVLLTRIMRAMPRLWLRGYIHKYQKPNII